MGRILSIDYGRKRTGLAVTDSLQMIATGLATVPSHELIVYLSSYFSKEKVDKIIVGYPRQMNNEPSENMQYVEAFVKQLRKNFTDMAIEYVDERLHTKQCWTAG